MRSVRKVKCVSLEIWLHLKTHLFLYFDLKTPNFENIWSFPLQTLLGALWKKCAQFCFLPFDRGRRQKSSFIAFFLSRSIWVSVDRHTVRNISSSLLVWTTQSFLFFRFKQLISANISLVWDLAARWRLFRNITKMQTWSWILSAADIWTYWTSNSFLQVDDYYNHQQITSAI